MSLIKEALDKVEREKEEGEGTGTGEVEVQETEADDDKSAQSFTVSTVVWSVIIVVLATLVGGLLAVLLIFPLR